VTVKRPRGIDNEAGEKILDSIELTNNMAQTAYINVMKLEILVDFQEWGKAIDLGPKGGRHSIKPKRASMPQSPHRVGMG